MAGDPESAANFRPERKQELAALEKVLLPTPGRVAMVHGAPGSGKTELALAFQRKHADSFPGGQEITSGIHLEPGEPLPSFSGDAPSLLIIDEADLAPIDWLTATVRQIRRNGGKTSLLMTARIPIMPTADTFLIETPPLNAEEIMEVLHRHAWVPSERLEALVSLLAGNAEAAELASRRLASGFPPERIIEWLESGRFAPARNVEGGPMGEDSASRRRLDLKIGEVSEELIQKLSANPDLLYKLDPRKFEKLVAELYRRRGFETTLTPASGDEGADVYVVSHNDLGRTLWVVQAKRNAPDRKIEAGVVRELLGTVTAKNASAGILITTSFFQPGAKDLERQLEYRLSLKDYLDLQELLRGKGNSGVST
jgi:restriction system protein